MDIETPVDTNQDMVKQSKMSFLSLSMKYLPFDTANEWIEQELMVYEKRLLSNLIFRELLKDEAKDSKR